VRRPNSSTGLWVAIALIGLWSITLIYSVYLPIEKVPLLGILGLTLLRTILQTGLFITAHDGMHGSIYPSYPRLNHRIGALALRLYAFLPYKTLLKKHHLHHAHPASHQDPDFHDGNHTHPIQWYFGFMIRYLNLRQNWIPLFTLITVYFYLQLYFSAQNLFLFWILPLILSSMQLFYFGTYLPHREPKQGYSDDHRASSSSLSPFWALMTCYYFGYHWEHHEYPQTPWFHLARLRNVLTPPTT
jgi:beta-carotene ketolase (CrtW type)